MKKNRSPELGTWNPEFGTFNPEAGTWIEPRTRKMESASAEPELGTRNMEAGIEIPLAAFTINTETSFRNGKINDNLFV